MGRGLKRCIMNNLMYFDEIADAKTLLRGNSVSKIPAPNFS